MVTRSRESLISAIRSGCGSGVVRYKSLDDDTRACIQHSDAQPINNNNNNNNTMYTRICLAASDFGLRYKRALGKEGYIRHRRVIVLHNPGSPSCRRCKSLRSSVRNVYATIPVSKAEYILVENQLARNHTPHRCYEDQCSSQFAERRDLDFAFFAECSALRNNRADFTSKADKLLYTIARYNRLPMNNNICVSPSNDSVPCTVCCCVYGECVCY